MSEGVVAAQTNRLARASHNLGVLGLLLLLLSGLCIQALVARGNYLGVLNPDDVMLLSLGATGSQTLAFVAALAALVLGFVGLAEIGRGVGNVQRKGLAVSGIVTATLTLLTLLLECGLAVLAQVAVP